MDEGTAPGHARRRWGLGCRSRCQRRTATAPVVAAAAIAMLAMLLGGCTSAGETSSGDGPGVLASTSVLADITTNIVCGDIEVDAIVPVGVDVHTYEPTVHDADTVRSAQLIVANGLGLEERLTDTLDDATQSGVDVYEVGPDVDPRRVDGRVDPHVWTDPDRMAAAVPSIAQHLKDLEVLRDADGVEMTDDRIDRCARQYRTTLEALGDEMDRTLAVVAAPQRKLVTNHEALTYFAERFDFEVIGAVIPSTSSLGEPNPRELDELAAAMSANGVTTVFGEVTAPTKVARSLTDRLGESAQVVELYTESLGPPGSGATTYAEMMRTDAQRIAAALAPVGSPLPADADAEQADVTLDRQ